MPQDFASWHRSQIAAGLPWAHSRAAALEVFESMQPPAPSPAERQSDAEIARLRSEVAALNARLGRFERLFRHRKTGELVALDTLIAAVRSALGQCRAEIEDRVEKLESRPALNYRGTWSEAEEYKPGDLVTCHGTAWYCRAANTGMKPGATTSGLWQCFVRRGRDAKPVEPAVR